MPRARDVNHVQVARLDDPIEMSIDKIQARRGSPMTQQTRLDVLFAERFFQQRIVIEINLSHR